MIRRSLLGGALALLVAPGDAMALRSQWPAHAPRRRLRWSQLPPDNVPNLAYAGPNKLALTRPESERRVVMMGDSITYNWEHFTRPFFAGHGLVGRGIGGETSGQMLLRFTADVVALKPRLVHIMAGTNDLAAGRRPFDGQLTRNNIETMAALAKDNGIGVILASIPPASGFSWRRPGDPMRALKDLNAWIDDLCAKNGYTYCDYWPVLRDTGDRLKRQYGKDTVHPNPAGYAVMGPVLLAAIDRALKPKPG